MVFTFGNDKMAIEGSHNNLHFRCEDQPWYMAFSASSFFSPLNKAQWTHLLGSTWPNHCLKSTCPLCKSWKPLGYGMCWVHTYIYHCAHFAAYLKKNWLVCPTRLHPNSSHAPHGAWLFLPNMDHVPWTMFHGPYPTHSIICKEQGSIWLSLKHCDSLARVIGYWSELWEFPWLHSKGTCCLCKEWACSLLSSTLSY
jgi:hypothetical protein